MANPRMTAEIGRVLGGRYRLVAPIGMGASAQVYLADDVKLRRRVAVKMLHDALADDTEFLRRFRAEARAAAALSHPNVMAVYDWSDGEGDDGTAFIVTEYLPGGSLRALLDSGALLTTAQALAVGVEAARALDYAHRRGFVHRDIKPANLLFGEEQRLRIADFGLARALAEAAWTEPSGAVLGTARYASPEQAKGESLTGEADVYALALVLIESVTGEVPFVADTTLGTLMARVDRPLEVPEALGPLQAVLAGAGHPDPEQRIDARTMVKGLLRAAKELSRPGPLPLVGALAAGSALEPDADPTLHAGRDAPPEAAESDLTAEDLDLDPPSWVNQAEPVEGAAAAAVPVADRVPAPEGPPAVPPGEDANAPAPSEPVSAEVELVEDLAARGFVGIEDDPITDEVARVVVPDAGGPPTDQRGSGKPGDRGGDGGRGAAVDTGDQADGSDGSRHRRWPWVALVLLVVGIAGAGGAYLATRPEPVAAGPAVVLPMPNVVGLDIADATEVAEAAGWKVATVEERKDGTTKGEVLASKPTPGVRTDDGATITLTVSAGQTIVAVPTDLGGKTFDDAEAALAKAGFKAKKGEARYSEDVAEGSVIGVLEGTKERLEKGSTVTLVVSKGPEPRPVPTGLVGSTEDDAKTALADAGLKAAVVRDFSDTVPEGEVFAVSPESGTTVEKGSTVTLNVSKGPELVAVPDVSGADSISEAISILEDAGLVAGEVTGPAAGSPVGTSPGAGSMVTPGSTVDIRLG